MLKRINITLLCLSLTLGQPCLAQTNQKEDSIYDRPIPIKRDTTQLDYILAGAGITFVALLYWKLYTSLKNPRTQAIEGTTNTAQPTDGGWVRGPDGRLIR